MTFGLRFFQSIQASFYIFEKEDEHFITSPLYLEHIQQFIFKT